MSIDAEIQILIDNNKVILFMKGTPIFPQCGFSGRVIHMIQDCDATFETVNVLERDDIRQGIKAFSNWPTIPQLYINGQFIGGCDIVTDMYQSGDLQNLLKQA